MINQFNFAQFFKELVCIVIKKIIHNMLFYLPCVSKSSALILKDVLLKKELLRRLMQFKDAHRGAPALATAAAVAERERTVACAKKVQILVGIS